MYAGYAGAPSADAFAKAGARRISLGCGPLQAALGVLGRIAAEAFDSGSNSNGGGFRTMAAEMIPAGEINGLFAGARR